MSEKRYNSQGQEIRSNRAWREENEQLRKVLAEISLGRGPYAMDPLKHADNCIEAMKKLASNALQGVYDIPE